MQPEARIPLQFVFKSPLQFAFDALDKAGEFAGVYLPLYDRAARVHDGGFRHLADAVLLKVDDAHGSAYPSGMGISPCSTSAPDLETMPLHLRAGAVVPFGPIKQYADELPAGYAAGCCFSIDARAKACNFASDVNFGVIVSTTLPMPCSATSAADL